MSYDRESWLRRRMREELLAELREQVADERMLEVRRADREKARADAAELELAKLRREAAAGATADGRVQALTKALADLHAKHQAVTDLVRAQNQAIKQLKACDLQERAVAIANLRPLDLWHPPFR